MILLLLLIDRFNFILLVEVDALDGGGGGGGSLGRLGVLVKELALPPAFSLKDCEIPRLPSLETLNASLTDGLVVFIRIRVVSLKRCECFAPLTSSGKQEVVIY